MLYVCIAFPVVGGLEAAGLSREGRVGVSVEGGGKAGGGGGGREGWGLK